MAAYRNRRRPRKCGLSIDNVIGADVVLDDGSFVDRERGPLERTEEMRALYRDWLPQQSDDICEGADRARRRGARSTTGSRS